MTDKQDDLDPEFLRQVLDDKSAERSKRAIVEHVAKNPALKHAIAERNAIVAEDDEKRLGFERQVAARVIGQIAADVAATVETPRAPDAKDARSNKRAHTTRRRAAVSPDPIAVPVAIATHEQAAAPAGRARWTIAIAAFALTGIAGLVVWLAIRPAARPEPSTSAATDASSAPTSVPTPHASAPDVPTETSTVASTAPPRPSSSAVALPQPSAKPRASSFPSSPPHVFGSGWTLHDGS